MILKHAPLKKLTIQEKKLRLKPWITTGVLTSIKTGNRISRKFLRTKNATAKQQLHDHFKYYRNNLTKITKASEALHYKKLFKDNKGNLRKTKESIREIINISEKKQMISNISDKNLVVDNPKDISEHFNNHFYNIAKKMKKKFLN